MDAKSLAPVKKELQNNDTLKKEEEKEVKKKKKKEGAAGAVNLRHSHEQPFVAGNWEARRTSQVLRYICRHGKQCHMVWAQ